MRDEIDRIRESRDRADTMAAPHETGEGAFVVPAAYASASKAGPPPATVQLGGDAAGSTDDSAEDDPQDTAQRPTIRVLGSVRGGRAARRPDDRIERSGVDDGSGASDAPEGSVHAIDPDAKRAYDAALALVNAKHFDRAIDALAAFLIKWPDHPYANNAMFWRGECYFARGEYPKAVEQFEGVLRRFPAGNKAPDALLKLGVSHQKLGNAAAAKECFDRLAQQYPDSEAARRIPAIATRAATPPGPAQESQP